MRRPFLPGGYLDSFTRSSFPGGNIGPVGDAEGLFVSPASLAVTGGAGTLTYTPGDPMAGVTKDATSNKFVPANLTEWATTIAAAGISISPPDHLWLLQDAGTPYAAAIGSISLSDAGSRHDNAVTITGWSRKGQRSRGDEFKTSDSSLPNPLTQSQMLLVYAIPEVPGVSQTLSSNMYFGDAVQDALWQMQTDGTQAVIGLTSTNGLATVTNVVHPMFLQSHRADSKVRLVTDQEKLEGTIGSPDTTKYIALGGNSINNGAVSYLYCAAWDATNAEISTANMKLLLQTLGWTVAW